jgi:NTP pyrophosphohydrolases containing a Zn-finger, probably nucleic-acid-binding
MIQEIFPHRFDNHYQPGEEIGEQDFILHYKGNTLLLKTNGDELELPKKQDLPTLTAQSQTTFLFTLNDVSCFIVWDEPVDYDTTLSYQEISFFRTASRKEMAWVSIVGYHLRNWYAEHRFCGKCGAKTYHKADERALVCTECNTHFFPKISPAIIVAITCGDKILLARNVSFVAGRYALIAGYADVGETLEETVIREVKEEVGLDVKNIRYYKSQPWPLSGSLMIGFIAEADETQPIVTDEHEIAEAAWFSSDNLPDYPSPVSIAGEMIGKFERGEL